MLIFKTSLFQVNEVKTYLSSVFKMRDMGEVNVILGINIMRFNDRIILSQSYYVEKIRKRFVMLECSLVSTLKDGSLKLLPHEGSPI